MIRKRACRVVVLAGVLLVMGLAVGGTEAQTITVNLVQVRASNEGPEHVDPSLGALGQRLRRRYPYRNYTRVAESRQSGNVGGTVQFALSGGMALTLKLTGYEAPVVSMHAVVRRGRAQVIAMNLRVPKGKTFIISVPLAGGDALILAIRPHLK